MSEPLISRNPDLQRLRDEGFDIDIVDDHLLVRDIPYVAAPGTVKLGTLVSTLTMAGDFTAQPDTHVGMWIGDYPCDQNGATLENIRSADGGQITPNITTNYAFSSKPVDHEGRYTDYYDKVTAYVNIFEGYAKVIDSSVDARTFNVVEASKEESVFKYIDTASSRAGISLINAKLATGPVAIVGLGGTGSYVLDFLAKTPVSEIHLFDEDILYSHNAFRAPGAASIEDLRAKQPKVEYLARIYGNMRRAIVPHAYGIDEENAHELDPFDFVFICIDDNGAKGPIVAQLEAIGKPFVDVGMGIGAENGALGGILRTILSSEGNREAFHTRVSTEPLAVKDDYKSDIQVADLNALNAIFAVMRWKKNCGFYHDTSEALSMLYTVDSDLLLREDDGKISPA